ncbi:hypothetical protein ABG067_004376 [Albugo candida]
MLSYAVKCFFAGERMEITALLTKNEEIEPCSLQSYSIEKLTENMEEDGQHEAFEPVHGSNGHDRRIDQRFHLFIEFKAVQLGPDSLLFIVFGMKNPQLPFDRAQLHITINANHTKTDESVHAFKSCNLNLSIVNDVMKQMDKKGWGHRYRAYIEENGNLDLVSHE